MFADGLPIVADEQLADVDIFCRCETMILVADSRRI